jgi:hypothetical protein
MAPHFVRGGSSRFIDHGDWSFAEAPGRGLEPTAAVAKSDAAPRTFGLQTIMKIAGISNSSGNFPAQITLKTQVRLTIVRRTTKGRSMNDHHR